MEPLRVLLGRYLSSSGVAWEQKQRAALCKAMRANLSLAGARQYRLQQAAEMEFESERLEKLEMLVVHAEFWEALPDSCKTFKTRALVFKMMSKIGCCVEFYLRERHRQWHFKVFMCINKPELLEVVVAEAKRCLRKVGTWGRNLLSLHPTLSGPECMAKLIITATLAEVDTADLECSHAAMRRRLMLRSTQCPKMALSDLAAEMILRAATSGNSAKLSSMETKRKKSYKVFL